MDLTQSDKIFCKKMYLTERNSRLMQCGGCLHDVMSSEFHFANVPTMKCL